MFRHVPNAITTGRLILAAVFFAMLSVYQYEGRGDPWFLNSAFVIYLVALFTDFLDGYLARKWKVESPFGRIVDPFVDKILVLGSFIFFAGKNFIIPDRSSILPNLAHIVDQSYVVRTITGVAPGIVVILLARELLVTSFRGMAESTGQNFGAQFSGKLKMVFQSVTILVILVYVNYHKRVFDSGYEDLAEYFRYFRDFCIWATVAVTVFSGFLYIGKIVSTYRAPNTSPSKIPPNSPSSSTLPTPSDR